MASQNVLSVYRNGSAIPKWYEFILDQQGELHIGTLRGQNAGRMSISIVADSWALNKVQWEQVSFLANALNAYVKQYP